MAAHARATTTAAGELPATPRPLPYRTLASVVDITAGDDEQTLRILCDLDPGRPVRSLDEVRPRLDRAEHWINTQVPAEQRTLVRTSRTPSCWPRWTSRRASRCGCWSRA